MASSHAPQAETLIERIIGASSRNAFLVVIEFMWIVSADLKFNLVRDGNSLERQGPRHYDTN